MAKILSFFGFILGFVLMSVLLAGVTTSGSVSAREDTATCEVDASLSGYGIAGTVCTDKN